MRHVGMGNEIILVFLRAVKCLRNSLSILSCLTLQT